MYLWKSWRGAWLSVAIYSIPFVVLIYGMLRHGPVDGIGVGGPPASVEWMMTRFLSIAGALLLFVGWSVGGDGIGHDIADDNGAFLLTRPRSRRFFVWSDSGFSLGLMAALAWGTMLLFELGVLVRLIPFAHPSILAFVLIPFCGVIFAGLVYAVTYLCTMLIPRNGAARVVSVAVLIGYSYLHVKAFRTWGGVTRYIFPSWWVDPFPFRSSSAVAPHVWLELGARVIAIVMLLLIAQVVLGRREIRA
jgi:hypothetical protein